MSDLSAWALQQQVLQQMLLSQMAQNNILIQNNHYMVLKRKEDQDKIRDGGTTAAPGGVGDPSLSDAGPVLQQGNIDASRGGTAFARSHNSHAATMEGSNRNSNNQSRGNPSGISNRGNNASSSETSSVLLNQMIKESHSDKQQDQSGNSAKSLFPNLESLYSNDSNRFPVSLSNRRDSSSSNSSTSRKRMNARKDSPMMRSTNGTGNNERCSIAPDSSLTALSGNQLSALASMIPIPSSNPLSSSSSFPTSTIPADPHHFGEIDMNLFQTRLKEQHDILRQQQNRALGNSSTSSNFNLNDSMWPQQNQWDNNSMMFNSSQNGAPSKNMLFGANGADNLNDQQITNDAFMMGQQQNSGFSANQPGAFGPQQSNNSLEQLSQYNMWNNFPNQMIQHNSAPDNQQMTALNAMSHEPSLEAYNAFSGNPLTYAQQQFPSSNAQPSNTMHPTVIQQVNNINNNNTFIDNQFYNTNLLQPNLLYGNLVNGFPSSESTINNTFQPLSSLDNNMPPQVFGGATNVSDALQTNNLQQHHNHQAGWNSKIGTQNMDLNSLVSSQQAMQNSHQNPSNNSHQNATKRHNSHSENFGFTPRMNSVNALMDLENGDSKGSFSKSKRDVRSKSKKSRKRSLDSSGQASNSGNAKKKRRVSTDIKGKKAGDETTSSIDSPPDSLPPTPSRLTLLRTTGSGLGRGRYQKKAAHNNATSSEAIVQGTTETFPAKSDRYKLDLSRFEKLFPKGKIEINLFDEEERQLNDVLTSASSPAPAPRESDHATAPMETEYVVPNLTADEPSVVVEVITKPNALKEEPIPIVHANFRSPSDTFDDRNSDSAAVTCESEMIADTPQDFNYESVFDHHVSYPFRHNNRDYCASSYTQFHSDLFVKRLNTVVRHAICSDTDSGKVVTTVSSEMPICHKPEYAPINHMSLSHDGRMMSSVSSNGAIRVWDISGNLNNESTSLNVNLLLELRDLNLERRKTILHEYYCALFTPDDSKIVVGGKLKDRFKWDHADHDNKILPCPLHVFSFQKQIDNIKNDRVTEPDLILDGHEEEILCLTGAWFCDKYYLLTGSYDGSVIRWKLGENHNTLEEKKRVLDGISGTVFSIQFVPDTFNRFFLTASDKCIRLYDMQHMTLLKSFDTPYTSYCDHLRFVKSSLSNRLSAQWERSLEKSDSSGAELTKPHDYVYYFVSHGVESMKNDKPVKRNKCLLHRLCIHRETNSVWMEEVCRFESKSYLSNAWLIHPEIIGKYLICPGSDGKLYFFDLETGEMVKSCEAHYGQIRQILADPFRNRFYTCGDDGQCNVFVYKAETERPKN